MEGATSFVTHYIYWQKSELKQHDMSPSSTHSFNFDRWSADANFRNIAVICQNAGFFISRTLWFTAARLLVVSLKTRNLQARNSFLAFDNAPVSWKWPGAPSKAPFPLCLLFLGEAFLQAFLAENVLDQPDLLPACQPTQNLQSDPAQRARLICMCSFILSLGHVHRKTGQCGGTKVRIGLVACRNFRLCYSALCGMRHAEWLLLDVARGNLATKLSQNITKLPLNSESMLYF